MADIEHLNPSFRAALMAMINESGGKIGIESAYRDSAKQAQLFKQYGPGRAARPGHSMHEKGLAADLKGDLRLAAKLAPKYGLVFTVQGEDWHVEPAWGRSGKDPGTGGSAGTQGQSNVQTADSQLAAAAPDPVANAMGALADLINTTSGTSQSGLSGNSLPNLNDTSSLPQLGNAIVPDPQPGQNQRLVEGSKLNPGGNMAAAPAGGGGGAAAGKFADLFNNAGKKYGIDPRLLSAVARAESGYNPNARSGAGAQGLMQFMPGTARGLGVNPMDPASAVDGAARMLSGLVKQFGSVDKALAAYNAGPGAVKKYGGIPPFKETQAYVKRILGYMG